MTGTMLYVTKFNNYSYHNSNHKPSNWEKLQEIGHFLWCMHIIMLTKLIIIRYVDMSGGYRVARKNTRQSISKWRIKRVISFVYIIPG